MSNGSKVLIYLSLYLSAPISRIVDSNPAGLISSTCKCMFVEKFKILLGEKKYVGWIFFVNKQACGHAYWGHQSIQKFTNTNFAHFLEDKTKQKTPSEIQLPLLIDNCNISLIRRKIRRSDTTLQYVAHVICTVIVHSGSLNKQLTMEYK